jgi:hypothetical protein
MFFSIKKVLINIEETEFSKLSLKTDDNFGFLLIVIPFL